MAIEFLIIRHILTVYEKFDRITCSLSSATSIVLCLHITKPGGTNKNGLKKFYTNIFYTETTMEIKFLGQLLFTKFHQF